MSQQIQLRDGQNIAYDVREHGDVPVVQLHGLTSSRARDEVLGLDFTVGMDGVRALRYDAPGHGESVISGPCAPEDFAWSRLADVLLEMLDGVFSFSDANSQPPQVVGIGQSMGTATLLTAASAHPERFSGLILAIPPTIWELRQAQTEQYRRFADLVENHGMAMFREAANSSPLPPAIDPERPETDPDVALDVLPTLFRGAAMTDLPEPSAFEQLDVPVLILGWAEDPSHPVWSAETLHGVLPNSELEIAETPEDVRKWPARMDEFIRKCLGPGVEN